MTATMPRTSTFTIVPQGRFSLRESALFGFGQRMRPAGCGDRDPSFDGVMRLAFCLDRAGGPAAQVGVEVRQGTDGVHGVVHGGADADLAAVQAQVARTLSLDHDARDYDRLGERDAVVASLQAAAPGLRPPLFYSPYEAAVWAVLSARRPGWQMDAVRTELSRQHGAVFDLAGVELAALPTPGQLLGVRRFARIEAQRLERLHGVAQAAADGVLDVEVLRAMPPAEAMQRVQQIKGIGAFYAALIVIRAVGHTDVLPENEPRVRSAAGDLYGLGRAATPEEFADIAQRWTPWRTWCSVLLRAAGHRVAPTKVSP